MTKSKKVTRLTFRTGNVISQIALDVTDNDKIARDDKEVLIQTYHYSVEQFNHVKNGGRGINLKTGFLNPELTQSNCLSCPLREGGCYTFKFNQALGNKGKLEAIARRFETFESIPEFNESMIPIAVSMLDRTSFRYIRFGSYGCPTANPLSLVAALSEAADNYTGYTHEWHRSELDGYKDYFMASCHKDSNMFSKALAEAYGWRVFVTDDSEGTLLCPNTSHGISCSKCGLCSGAKGKGKVSIMIPSH
jgi:hypothetical protein